MRMYTTVDLILKITRNFDNHYMMNITEEIKYTQFIRQRVPKGHSSHSTMDNPDKLATLGTQDTENTLYMLDTTIRKQTHKQCRTNKMHRCS